MTIHELLIYDERKVITNISPCYVQRQTSEIVSKEIPVFELDYQAFPQPKQIISMNIRSMRLIFVLDFVQQLYDILYGSMTTSEVSKVQPNSEANYDVRQVG